MKVVAIIQARMTSTRLPGKVLLKVKNKSLLEYQLERVKRAKLINEIIVATTLNTTDDILVDECKKLGVRVYRGSEDDVLSRYYEAANKYKADVIVRLTSDCPLIDPEVIDEVIQLYLDKPTTDYAANTLERTYPRGLDVEVFSFQTLEKAHRESTLLRDREHVTAYIHMNRDMFICVNLASPVNHSHHRWTVDTEEDFELIKRILQALYSINPTFKMNDVIALLEENPSCVHLNAHIEQKKL